MTTPDDAFLERLRATFKVEAAEHLQAIAAGLLELEKAPAPTAQPTVVETVFRAAHSLKGAARAVDLGEIESLCQSLEDVFAAWKRRESSPSPFGFDALHRTLDDIAAALSAPETARGLRADKIAGWPSFTQPVKPPRMLEPEPIFAESASQPAVTAEKGLASADSVRISVARLDARLLEAEEMLTVKLL
ncbi:MAG TPA: Hpt domain-containing protein, partial [Ramlibacter sp.]|nr:Hpt domain-containing protein [Ramlibacter sp.]